MLRRAVRGNQNGIKGDVPISVFRMSLEPDFSRADNARLLARRDGFDSLYRRTTPLDFDEGEAATARDDQVDFS